MAAPLQQLQVEGLIEVGLDVGEQRLDQGIVPMEANVMGGRAIGCRAMGDRAMGSRSVLARALGKRLPRGGAGRLRSIQLGERQQGEQAPDLLVKQQRIEQPRAVLLQLAEAGE